MNKIALGNGFGIHGFVHLGFLMVIAIGWAPAGWANDAAGHLNDAKSAMRATDFDQAIKALELALEPDAKPGEEFENVDEAMYLKALAQFYLGQHLDSINTTNLIVAERKDSAWYRKARFLKARSFVSLRRYEEAESIYEEEAERLLSSARKHEIAGVIINFADALATKPGPNDVGALPPDYNKAYKLYSQALAMEIGRDLRDQVMFKRGTAILNASNFGAAIKDFREYLTQFDPDWTGIVGSVTRMSNRRKESPKPAGKHILEARFHLIQAQLKAGQSGIARVNAQDLLRMIDGVESTEATKHLNAATSWRLVQTYAMPKPARAELEQAVKATRDFLKQHPQHPRSVQAAWYIPEAYRNHGRSDQAIAAYRDVVDRKGFDLPDGEVATDKLADLGKSPAELLDNWRKQALYQIGNIRFAQKQYDRAIEIFTKYTNQFPSGPNWSNCQRGIVNARYQAAVDAVSEKKYEDARDLFNAFLTKHPLDGRAPQILFLLGQMDYVAAKKLEEQRDASPEKVADAFKKTVDRWQRLVNKYPNTQQSSLALYQIGVIYEEKLGDFEQALTAFRRLTWGSSAGNARSRVSRMTQKFLQVTTERKFRTNEQVTINLSTRNTKKLTCKQYFLDLEAYFRKTHQVGRVEALDIDLIQPDKTWDVEIDGYTKYMPIEQKIEIPFEDNKAGVCLVNVSSDDLEATTLVIRSDLDLIVKSSRRELLVFVQDMLREVPAAGVKLLASNGSKVFAVGETDENGIFQGKFDELKDAKVARVFALSDGSVASNLLDLGGLGFSAGLAAKGYLYTDRPAYQPGQTVKFRGVIRDVKDGAYVAPKDDEYMISIMDASGRQLWEKPVKLSEFGSFHTEFALNQNTPLGEYKLQASKKDCGTYVTTFQVQKFKLEKMKLTLTTDQQVYYRGEQIELSVNAQYYWGQAVADRAIRYTLPDGRTMLADTDKEGKLIIKFDTSGMQSGSLLNFSASIEGENVQTAHVAMLAVNGFNIKVTPDRTTSLSGEPIQVEINTSTMDGKPVSRDLTLYVLRRSIPAVEPVLHGVPWITVSTQPALETTIVEKKVKTDDKGKATITLDDPAMAKGGIYILRASGEDRFKQVVSGQSQVRISDDDDATKLRFFANTSTLQVGRSAKLRLHSRVDAKLALLTIEGESMISHRIIPLRNGYNPIKLDIDHEHFPNFRLAISVMDGRQLRTASKPFRVQRQLNVKVRPLADVFQPGAKGKVELTITDQLGRPVRGELSLALVDEALFAAFQSTTPAILEFFQRDARRHAEFRQASTCGFSYAATTRGVVREYNEELARLERAGAQAAEIEQVRDRLKQLSDMQKSAKVLKGRVFHFAPNGETRRDGATIGGGFAVDPEKPKDDIDGIMLDERREIAGRKGFPKLRRAMEPLGSSAGSPRREMPEAGWWAGSIITDNDGKAVIEIPMPENTTQWRLTARGVTADTLVGQSQASVITRKDFFVSTKLPQRLMEGDSVRLISRIHNMTNFTGPVNLKLTVWGGADFANRLAERVLTVDIEKQGTVEAMFEAVKVPSSSRLKFQVDAIAGDVEDSLATVVPVMPWGLEFADQTGGIARNDATAYVELPPKRQYETQWMTVSVGPSLERSVIEMAMRTNLLWPQHHRVAARCIYPAPRVWGNAPGSDLLAVVSALEYAILVQAPRRDIERLQNRARSLVSGLVVSQHKDGGWTWRGAKYVDWTASSMNFWALCEARRLGVSVHAQTILNAQQFLKTTFTRLNQNDNDAKATILHALSFSGAADFAHVNRLHRERNKLSAPALAYTALTFVNLNRDDFAGEILDVLEAKATTENQQAYWKGSGNHAWFKDQVLTSAIATLALMKVRPDSKSIESGIKYLLTHQNGSGFRPAKAHGPAVNALCQYYAKGKYAQNDYRLTLKVNGKPFQTITSKDGDGTTLLSVPTELLVKGKNQVDFAMEGRGEFSYAVSIRGFSSDLKDPVSWRYPRVERRRYLHSQLEYRGRPIGATSSSPVKNIEIGQRVKVHVDLYGSYQIKTYTIVEEHLPAGMILVDGTLSGSFDHHIVEADRILMYYRPGRHAQDFHYDLIGYSSGEYRVLPTVIRDAMEPSRMRIGKSQDLVVLGPGEKSTDPYKMNDAERYALGKLYFDDGLYAKAATYLTHLYKNNRRYQERNVAQMLLWIYTSEGFYDAQQIVNVFEILRERYPTLEIPYGKILNVGHAYRDIGEFERAYQIFRATIDASFVNDSNVSAVLEDEGQFLGSAEYQENLWREYPDTAQVVGAYFALSQSLYLKAPQAHLLAKQQRQIAIKRGADPPTEKPSKIAMLTDTIRILSEFLAHYPTQPLADDAAFSMANALLDLKQYSTVVEACIHYKNRFAESDFETGFQYMVALGYFWQRQHENALSAAIPVAEGSSKDRDLARYIIGQIFHAENKPRNAIDWYQKVAQLYADAQQAIDYFEAKHVSMDEVNIFRPGKPVELKIKYRNIAEARCQVYRVDLMRLYLREKNLTNVTKINLAGIQPLVEKTIQLGDGKDYVDKEHTVTMDLQEEGAYLVICRGDNLFTSSLALITPLKIEVQEDATSGRVRANVINATSEEYVPEVHVKAIGSADSKFAAGDTDLRGIFIADNLRGKATVIARTGDARYAFYRGKDWLGAPENAAPAQPSAQQKEKPTLDYQQNLRLLNSDIQEGNFKQYDSFRRAPNKGVEVQSAK